MHRLNQPLTNVQLELLKAFSYNLNESDLVEFKNMMASYFAKKAIAKADQAWEEKGLSDKDVDQMLSTKMRRIIK